MALIQQRRIDRIEIVYPNPVLQVRFIDEIVDDEDNTVVATVGYNRTSYDFASDLREAPLQVQAAAAAIVAFQRLHPDEAGDPVVAAVK